MKEEQKDFFKKVQELINKNAVLERETKYLIDDLKKSGFLKQKTYDGSVSVWTMVVEKELPKRLPTLFEDFVAYTSEELDEIDNAICVFEECEERISNIVKLTHTYNLAKKHYDFH